MSTRATVTLPMKPPTAKTEPSPLPALVDARELARMLSVSLATIRRMDAGGRLPKPLHLSAGCVRWRTREIELWIAAGCPRRGDWTYVSD